MGKNQSRRNFIKNTALGLSSVTFIGAIETIQEEFLNQIVRQTGDGTDLSLIQNQYLLDEEIIYLNNASIGTIPKPVHQARKNYLSLCEKNPWYYMWSGAWDEPRERVRQKIAKFINAEMDEIAITHNTTEAFNLLANGLPLKTGEEVLFSNLNHPGASVAFHHRAELNGFTVRTINIPAGRVSGMGKDEIISLHIQAIGENTKLLVLPHIDNIIGLRHPIKEITKAARARGVPFIAVDAAQTVGMIPVDVKEMDVDLLATSPHKWLQAPKGLGIAYISKRLQEHLEPMWVTWGQNRWKETARIYEDYGTRNLPEVLALGNAIDFHKHIDDEVRENHLKKLWNFAREEADRNPKFTWYSPDDWELSGALFAIEARGHQSSDFFDAMFNRHGFVFRPFNTLGLNTNRISPNLYTTEDDLKRFFKTGGALKKE